MASSSGGPGSSDNSNPDSTPGALQAALQAKIAAGGKCLVPYIMGGCDGWLEAVQAAIAAGADAVEIGLPFSDPVMDGPVIQQASELALSQGATPESLMAEVAGIQLEVPLLAMTYYNLAYHHGLERFAGSLKSAGFSAAILADLPIDEADPWSQAAGAAELETVFLAAPTATPERCQQIAVRSQGFIYAVGLLGVTGEREQLAASATVIAQRLKQATSKPVLVGVGISTPENAVKAAEVADGVVVGSALVRVLLETGSPDAVGEAVGRFRQALDSHPAE